jgi:hypothetical protein
MCKLPVYVLSILAAGILSASAQGSPPQSGERTATTHENTEQQHPEWFHETYNYRPCPADVEFSNGKHACLGGGK